MAIKVRKIKEIIVHCSDSAFGDAALITEWHKARKFRTIGYHYVILNGRRKANDKRVETGCDGLIEYGRPVVEIGAHAAGDNAHSIGICLIGKDGLYTMAQISTLVGLIKELSEEHNFSHLSIRGHYQTKSGMEKKTCPDFDISYLEQLLV